MFRTGILMAVSAAGIAVLSLLAKGPAGFEMVPVQLDGRTLAVAVDEISVGQWLKCQEDRACDTIANTAAQSAKIPVTGVNWFDVQDFIRWANAEKGRRYRLPTVEEWRLISGKPQKAPRKPLFDDPRMAWAASYGQEKTPGGPVRAQGTWSTTKDGIQDMEGNVWEWTASCTTDTQDPTRCAAMHVMGAHESTMSVFVRDPASGGCVNGTPPTYLGFRVVEDID